MPVKVVALKGQLDSHTVPDLEGAIKTELQSPPDFWAFDCAELEYISSAGLAAMVGLRYTLEERKGKLGFFGMSDKVFRVFKMLGMAEMFPIYATLDVAKDKFGL
jgi:anti-sigma B factor antagonist